MQKIKTVAETHDYDEGMIDKNVEESLCVDVQPFFIQKSGGDIESLVYPTVTDFKSQYLKTACDTNPVLVKFNIATSHLFFEFRENSYLDKDNTKFDYEGFLAVDLYSKNGQLCGVLALGREKGKYKSTQLMQYIIGQNGVAVFNKNAANAKINYCTNRIDVALKITQCGERVACASRLDDCVEFFLNTTNNSPIMVDTSHTNINALSLFNSDKILTIKHKIDLQTYLQNLYADFSQQYGIVEENPQIDKSLIDTIKVINMSDIQALPILWLWPGWLPLGKMTILAGAGGCGKTNLSLALVAIITRGGFFPDGMQCENPGRVLIYSTEDDPADTLKPRLIANGADINRVSFIAGRTNQQGKLEPFDPAKDFPKIEQYIKANQDLKLLMIDPIISAVSGDMNKANDVRRSLQPLVDLANQYGFAILGITHFAKGSANNSPADRILGSQAFSALARMAWCASRREADGDYILVRAKSNISVLDGGICYQLESVTIADKIETTKTNWLGKIDGFAKELLNSAELNVGDNNSAVEVAKEFLIELLSDVERLPAKDVHLQAKEAGLSLSSIRRAQERLNIKPFRPCGEKVWFWSLPKIHRLDEPTHF
ncbi:AAA family ATPase [Acinetobacter sp. IK25]|uniref:AAA family ATPase n=1 Tax=Acinetobacter sp. IK25 TaxID=2928894 RepID=UPI002D1FCB93|nr:AAA family ATPase [Acinetobacter sp. IK25]MEB3836240.1 AAA family ATPase [Acinetobacter sp. IK25]